MSAWLSHTSARVLEFDGLLELLRGYTSSPLGRERVLNLKPSADLAWIENQHQLTSELREFRRVGGRFDFAGLLDVTEIVEKSGIAGAALETEEIRDVLLVMDRAAEWREILRAQLSNSVTDESMIGYLALGLSEAAATHQADDTEAIALVRVPFREALELAVAGELPDMLTVAMLLRGYHMAREGSLPGAISRAMLG